jgi:hypothetical protein
MHDEAESEEFEPLRYGCDLRLFRRQLNAHGLAQVVRQRGFFRDGILPCPRHQHDEVIGVAHRQKRTATSHAIPIACSACRGPPVTSAVGMGLGALIHPPFIPLFDRAERDIGKQW